MLVFRRTSDVTEGERNYYVALLGIGFLSAILAFAFTYGFHDQGYASEWTDAYAIWTLFAGAVGGVVGFFCCHQRWLGFQGAVGWLRAGIGGLMISGIAAVVTGTLILPYYGTMFGPFQLIIGMIEVPMLAVVWVAMLVAGHKLMIIWRLERESIFAG